MLKQLKTISRLPKTLSEPTENDIKNIEYGVKTTKAVVINTVNDVITAEISQNYRKRC